MIIHIGPMRFLVADLVKGSTGDAETYDDPGLGWQFFDPYISEAKLKE